MSMISELLERLDGMYDLLGTEYGYERQITKTVKEAAETIKELSEKLHNSQMERSSQYYNCGWIPVSERLPEIHQDMLLSLRSLDVEVGFRAETEPYFYCRSADGCYVEPQNVLA